MRLAHVPALDAIRGIAILLVLAVHADHAVPGGALGVDLFFVLSGFLITSLLLAEWGRDTTISLRSFYRRRALRLLPALVVMLAVVSVVAVLTAEDVRGQLVWVLYSLAYVINFAGLLEEGVGNESLQHMWSLSQEEQFYFVWPVLLLLLLRAGLRPRLLAGLLGVTAAALLVYRGVLAGKGVSVSFLLYAPDLRGVGLVLGCLAAVIFTGGIVRRIPPWLGSASLVPACVAAALFTLDGRWQAVYLVPAFCIAAAVVLLACVLHPEWWFARLIDRAWLRGLGRISYGLYLWHIPIYVAVGWVVGLPLAILVAVLSYRFVEQPFLRRRYQSRSRGDASPAQTPVEALATPAMQASSA